MSPRPHFLVLTFPLQGHIAPALRLARRLLAVAPDALVTFSTAAAAHRRMFADADDGQGRGSDEDDRLELLPFSDGTENGFAKGGGASELNDYMASFHVSGRRSVGDHLDALAARGRPVSRVVYTLLLPWAADVARERGVPSALYWIQPVAVLAIYYHYFHGHAAAIDDHRHDHSFPVDLPGLPTLTIGDIPSFLTDATDPNDYFHGVFATFRDLFDTLDREKPKATVLVNVFRELEETTLAAVGAYDVLTIGPVLPSGDEDQAGLFKQENNKYMEWLDARPAGSVVYVAFGSITVMAKGQIDELLPGLDETGRPYICVVRKDNKADLAVDGDVSAAASENGMVVEWCDQVRVLSHPAVGCFVTHCGWNSVLESVAAGVPMVSVPQMSDQRMNARLVERDWRVGVRAELDDGVLRAAELRRRVDEVMGEGEAAAEVRRTAAAWKRAVEEALGKGGSSDRNLMAFVESARSGGN
uniref:Glycosyltransferase n=1 Tax=Leersia perrieri TaxID=77586 RepID=A0A0D9WRQ2_9ORYZ